MTAKGDRCEATEKLCLSFALARETAKQMRRRHTGDKAPVSHYRCRTCGWWHVGGGPLRINRRRRAR